MSRQAWAPLCDSKFSAKILLPPANEVAVGNVFTGVYLSTEGVCIPSCTWAGGVMKGGVRQRGWWQEGVTKREWWRPTTQPVTTTKAGGTHPTGMQCAPCYINKYFLWESVSAILPLIKIDEAVARRNNNRTSIIFNKNPNKYQICSQNFPTH